MGRVWVVAVVAALAGGCSGGDDGRAAPKAGQQVVVAEFDSGFLPRGVAVDGAGTVYTSGWDGKRFVVAAFPEDGKPTRRPIPCATGEGAGKKLYASLAAAPDGTLFWGHADQFRVVRLDPDGGGDCYAGTGERGSSGDGGPAAEAQFGGAYTLAYDAERGDLYISDSIDNVIRKVDAGGVMTTVAGPEGGTGLGPEVAFDQRRGRLYAYSEAGIVYRDSGGAFTVLPGTTQDADLPLGNLAVDPRGGGLVAARVGNPEPDRDYCDVVRISDEGKVRPVRGSGLLPECAEQLAVDAAGDVWVVTDDRLIVVRPPR